MSPKTRRIVLWGAIAAVLIGGLAYAFRPQPVAVDLGTVTRGPLTVTVDEEGKALVRDVYTVSAPIGGTLQRIDVEAGDEVTKDQTELARIEPADPTLLDVRTKAELGSAVEAARAARDLATAELERARAELAFAEADLKRARELITRGTIAQRTLDEAQRARDVAAANVETAKAGLEMRQHELETAQARLLTGGRPTEDKGSCACVMLTAPVSGTVLRVIEESKTVVRPGMPLVEIGNPHDLEIVADLLSEDAVKVSPGQAALITGWGGPTLHAVVRRVEPYGYTKVSALGIEEQRVDVHFNLTDPPAMWRRLGHGYRVEVAVVMFHATVLQVPLGALFRNGDGWAVFVARNGRAHLREVKIGHRNTTAVEVLHGLDEGEKVVLYPSDQIGDGVRIEPRQSATGL